MVIKSVSRPAHTRQAWTDAIVDWQGREATLTKAKQQAAAPQPEPPDDDNPFTTLDAGTLRQLHALGRSVHGDEGWREIGPERVTAHSDGRAKRSDQLSHAEALRLINELQGQLEQKDTPEYAG